MTVVGIQFGALLGGAIVIESLFALPGVGRLDRDVDPAAQLPVVQGGVLVVAVLFILVTLVTDLIVGWLDPRTAAGAAVSVAVDASAPRRGVWRRGTWRRAGEVGIGILRAWR